MLLYHGTKESFLSDVLQNGIRPRSGNEQGNHADAIPELRSRPGMVYLASAGPVQYAEMAKGEGRLLLLEIETDRLDQSNMVPDEDSLAHEILHREGLTNGAAFYKRFVQLLSEVDPAANQDRWQELLEKSGSVAHSGIIAPQALTRYALMDKVAAPKFFEVFEAICMLASARKGMRHRFMALAPYIFDGDVEPLFAGNDLEQIQELLNTLRKEWEASVEVVAL